MPAVAYYLSIRTYGTWLHGDARWSVGRKPSRETGDNLVPPNTRLERYERSMLKRDPVIFDIASRDVVQATFAEVCSHRQWTLHAVNAMTNHVHAIVSASSVTPERAMNDLKAWATRRLAEAQLVPRGLPVWARHGSTRYVYDAKGLAAACEYVVNRQDDRGDRDGEEPAWMHREPPH